MTRSETLRIADVSEPRYDTSLMGFMHSAQAVIAEQIEDFAKFPPRQKPASFNLDSVMEQVKTLHG